MNQEDNTLRDSTTPKNEIANSLMEFLKDKNGNHSLREIVVLACLMSVLMSWIAQQFFHCIMPEYMFYAFVSLIGAGCFGYSLEKSSK